MHEQSYIGKKIEKGEENLLEINQSLVFLQKFILHPKQIGAVWPSSRFLADKMVQQVQWNNVSYIAELGSGTGVITKAIQSSLSESAKVFLFEKDAYLRSLLKRNFPEFICKTNACHLTKVIQQQGVQQLDCIISGLPFFNFPTQIREGLIDQIICSLKYGGYFIAFQYSLQMKKQLSHSFELERLLFVPLNFPPAFVYVCRKKGCER